MHKEINQKWVGDWLKSTSDYLIYTSGHGNGHFDNEDGLLNPKHHQYNEIDNGRWSVSASASFTYLSTYVLVALRYSL
jgi:hypothetical protein